MPGTEVSPLITWSLWLVFVQQDSHYSCENIEVFLFWLIKPVLPSPHHHTLGSLPREINIDTWTMTLLSPRPAWGMPLHSIFPELLSSQNSLILGQLAFYFNATKADSSKAGQPSLQNIQLERAMPLFLTVKAIHVLCLKHTHTHTHTLEITKRTKKQRQHDIHCVPNPRHPGLDKWHCTWK